MEIVTATALKAAETPLLGIRAEAIMRDRKGALRTWMSPTGLFMTPPKCPPLEERLKNRYVIMGFYSANKMSYIKRKKSQTACIIFLWPL